MNDGNLFRRLNGTFHTHTHTIIEYCLVVEHVLPQDQKEKQHVLSRTQILLRLLLLHSYSKVKEPTGSGEKVSRGEAGESGPKLYSKY